MLGFDGLMDVSCYVILNVNYIKVCLQEYYLVLFIGENGYMVYELIIDLCLFKDFILVVDVVKCLIDYSFYVLILSWLVVGIIMIEFIESESKVELDCFCDVMIEICKEIDEIVFGIVDVINNVLYNVLYVLEWFIVDEWFFLYMCK